MEQGDRTENVTCRTAININPLVSRHKDQTLPAIPQPTQQREKKKGALAEGGMGSMCSVSVGQGKRLYFRKGRGVCKRN